jgi:HlyD family secretion protein
MTIADMSIITAEVKVDETDIVNVKLGQMANIRVDALGDRILRGHVSEIGNSALTRTTGAASGPQVTAQEAKDFKVVVTLDDPPRELRPGLSCTAEIVTATRQHVLTVPIQAITIREVDPKKEIEGVFLVRNGSAAFTSVKTGIIGTTDIELTEGLAENDEVVTGPYQVLRTLKDSTRVRIEK